MSPNPKTASGILPECTKILIPAFNDGALKEAREVISAVTDSPLLQVIADPDRIILTEEEVSGVIMACKRRAGREPMGYITGKSFFMYHWFTTGPGVLVPRNDTERLAETVINELEDRKKRNIRYLDLFTGSGCIVISVIAEVLKKGIGITAVAADSSEKAVEYAKMNAMDLGVDKHLRILLHDILSDDIQELCEEGKKYDIVSANPPYIRSEEIGHLEPEVSEYEPVSALDGGEDGLLFYRVLSDSADALMAPGAVLIMEIGFDQERDVIEIFESSGKFSEVGVERDHSGNPRVLKAVYSGG